MAGFCMKSTLAWNRLNTIKQIDKVNILIVS